MFAQSHKVLIVGLLLISSGLAAAADTSIAFITKSQDAPGARNVAALAFANTRGKAVRIWPAPQGGWLREGGQMCAPEEFDVVWYHQGDVPESDLGDAAAKDLLLYIKGGGSLLLSGAAGRVLNDMTVEPTPLRVLGVSPDAFASALVVQKQYRAHPAFAGLDAGHPIFLTSFGGNALADFYGTAGPHGKLLAEGNSGVGERPVVEYEVGLGRVVFVGWRLPDFTTAHDAYRPNLDKFFGNLIGYLAQNNKTHAHMAAPPGKAAYVRALGLPFLKSAEAVDFDVPAAGAKSAAILTKEPTPDDRVTAGGLRLRQIAVTGDVVKAKAFGLTLFAQEKPMDQIAAVLRAEQDAMDKQDRERMAGLKVVTPDVSFATGPLKPLATPDTDQSVLLGRSPFMAPGDGLGDCKPYYEPIEDGGFHIANSARQINRPIVHGQNRVWTGDVPIFRMDTVTGNGSYSEDRFFPLWPRKDAKKGGVYPSMGTLRLGVTGEDGKPVWLDTLRNTTATFRPGYTQYAVNGPSGAWKAEITIAPALKFHGLVCRVKFDKPQPLVWQYGGVYWDAAEKNANHVAISGNHAAITEPNLPNNLVVAGWNGKGGAHVNPQPYGQQLEYIAAAAPQSEYFVYATWGVTSYDKQQAQETLDRLDRPVAATWGIHWEQLRKEWFEAYIGRARNPESNFKTLAEAPEAALTATMHAWDERRAAFQIHTPDPYLNALINWSRCTTDYHRKGPGLILGVQYWDMYSHISTGWYGKEWGGDHEAIEDNLRLYGALQADDGFIRWISPSLFAFNAENNTPYWVDQVWRHYVWQPDKQFLTDLWPAVKKAVAWQRKHRDPDGDGLFQDFYEYWNCDSNGKGPKSAAPSAMSWLMLECAANIAGVVGDSAAEKEFRQLVAKTHDAIFRELWREKEGRLGSIGADGIWRPHPQTWEEYLAINAGLLSPEQGRSAMRWLEAHYGYSPQPDVHLLTNSDWWPIRWSTQWIPTGDTCLAVLGGLKSGDVALWWPYLRTAVLSAFHSDFPGINMGISNTGAGGGDREDVDSVDPYVHVAVRGVFGIEPALHENRLDICPAFPEDWKDASIRTPDLAYEYHREGDKAIFKIHTTRTTIKHVRANLTGPEVVTPEEADSTVTVAVGPAIAPPQAPKTKPLLAIQADAEKKPPRKLTLENERKMVLFDLRKACNVTPEEMVTTPFIFDYAEGNETAGIVNWWGNPSFAMPSGPRMVQADNGIRFLTSGRAVAGLEDSSKTLIALSSWRPFPLPASVTVPVGFPCRSLWLLLQSYVSPIKNYIPNGEVVLHYVGGKQAIKSLVPPYNLDCYFQHFSREGIPIPMGQISGGSFIDEAMSFAHADALEIPCDPLTALESVEIRATCSEGVIGVAGMTLIEN